MLVTFIDLSQTRPNTNEQTLNTLVHHPNAKGRFHKSRMMSHVHSEGSCLPITKARSRAAGFLFLAGNDSKPSDSKPIGGAHVQSTIMKTIMSSATKTKITATFDSSK